MREFIKEFYKSLYKEDLIKTETIYIEKKPPVIEKTNGEKLLDFALTFYGTDPTPKDEVDDEVSCVWSLTTILNKYFKGEFKVIDYTPDLVGQLYLDKRFKLSNEFKEGNIVVFPTKSGNGKVIGHCFIVSKNGKMLSNNSATGLWQDKYDIPMMIERYSRVGQLRTAIFELL